jgi:hypothetical protein
LGERKREGRPKRKVGVEGDPRYLEEQSEEDERQQHLVDENGWYQPETLLVAFPKGKGAVPVWSGQIPALLLKCLLAGSLSSFSNAHIWAALPKRPMCLPR